MKPCTICHETKELMQFNKKKSSKDGLQSVCRPCNSTISKNYYRDNKVSQLEIIKKNSKGYISRNREYMYQYLIEHPCVDCGITDIRVLEFDHITDKTRGVGAMASRGVSIKVLESEIAKCEVRCRNCHVIKTYERMGGSWHDAYLLV